MNTHVRHVKDLAELKIIGKGSYDLRREGISSKILSNRFSDILVEHAIRIQISNKDGLERAFIVKWSFLMKPVS